MTALIVGLVLFLGAHSVRIVAEPWRTRMLARLGEGGWKGAYTVVSLLGFGLIIWGYAQSRLDPVPLWTPQPWARHLASLLTLVAFILLAAAYVPGNSIKARAHHPMVLGVKVWALAHLLANHTLADLLLFGGFLLWAVLDFRSVRRRDSAAGTTYAAGSLPRTAVTLVVGTLAWAGFALWAHAAWIGVRPFG